MEFVGKAKTSTRGDINLRIIHQSCISSFETIYFSIPYFEPTASSSSTRWGTTPSRFPQWHWGRGAEEDNSYSPNVHHPRGFRSARLHCKSVGEDSESSSCNVEGGRHYSTTTERTYEDVEEDEASSTTRAHLLTLNSKVLTRVRHVLKEVVDLHQQQPNSGRGEQEVEDQFCKNNKEVGQHHDKNIAGGSSTSAPQSFPLSLPRGTTRPDSMPSKNVFNNSTDSTTSSGTSAFFGLLAPPSGGLFPAGPYFPAGREDGDEVDRGRQGQGGQHHGGSVVEEQDGAARCRPRRVVGRGAPGEKNRYMAKMASTSSSSVAPRGRKRRRVWDGFSSSRRGGAAGTTTRTTAVLCEQSTSRGSSPFSSSSDAELVAKAKHHVEQLQKEIADAEVEIEHCIEDVRDGHKRARGEVLEHCDRMQTALAARKSLFLQELDRLETVRLALLNSQRAQLRVVRRNITLSGEEELGQLEQQLVEAETVLTKFERKMSNGVVRSDSILRLADGSSKSGEGGAFGGAAGGTDADGAPSKWQRKLSGEGSSFGTFQSLLKHLRTRLRLAPCVDPAINLDLRESQLFPLVERLGAIATNDFDLDEELLVGPLVISDAFLGNRGYPELVDGEKRRKKLPPEMAKVATLVGGCLAGVTSASLTHFLDVAKVLRQVGRRPPDTLRGYFIGLPMGAIAQGQRFGVTLFLNKTLQQKLNKTEHNPVLSFCGSMFASGVGEFLANPPVVVKNYQIANGRGSAFQSVLALHEMNGVQAYFKGVVPGVLRKSLANAIVLQSIGPTKMMLSPFFTSPSAVSKVGGGGASEGEGGLLKKMGVGFIAGSLTGSFAEVATNYPDRVKTLMQTKKVSLYDAAREAARDPFRGAFWAGLRKGVIRGFNWGTVGLYTTLFEDYYWKYKRVSSVL